MDRQQIIMSFSVPPGPDDLKVIAEEALETLPEEVMEFCENLSIQVEEVADEAMEQEFDLSDSYELVALYRSGKQISPGVEKKVANDDDVLVIFRRALLDIWCETGDDLNALMRQIMIEELAANFDFSDEEIEEMSRRHFQGML
ncbi:MAG: metallopeptidase family protein [Proteobacteria bacterium]|nr:metallopeptidase family protein [Pseudomonadota bacterium]